jgi:2-polyprenyl-3-methyl-5-hydroxy-6-metoxy-1,4-benzoquinol methylase
MSVQLPPYTLFRAACKAGLSVVRPLRDAARESDPSGWNYGCGWPPSYEAYGRMRALATLQQARGLRPRRILEIAAGDASLSACLAGPGVVASANDLREDALAAAVAMFKTRDQITVLAGNCFDLDPAQIGSFDLITACEVIEHVAHPADLLRHLKRFLEPRGHILLTTPNGLYFRNRLPTYAAIEDPQALETRQFKPDADGHLFLLTPLELNELAEQAGLQVEEAVLSATPFITGHLKLSCLRGPAMARLSYWSERICLGLPWRLKEKLCFSLSALLVHASPA